MRVRSFVLVLSGCIATAFGLVASAGAQQGYVALRNAGSIGGFDTGVNAISKTVQSFGDPRTMAITPTGSKVFVDDVDSNNLKVFETATNKLNTYTPGDGMFGLAINPAGDRAYVSAYSDNYVSVLDTATDAVVDTFAVGKPTDLAVSPDGTKLYVSSDANGDVIELNALTGAQNGSISMAKARDIVMTPDGSKLFVADQNDEKVYAISTASRTVLGSAASGTEQPEQLAISPDGKKVYAAGLELNKVTVIDAVQNSKLGTIVGFQGASGVAITANGKNLYVSSKDNDNVYVVDASTEQIVGNFPALSSPATLALTPGQAPIASFTASVASSGEVSFDGGGSGTLDGTTITRYDWDFGDGTTLSDGGQKPQHTYSTVGSYTVTLTVTNSDGVSTEKVSNGVQLLRNGGNSARTTASFTVGGSSGVAGTETFTSTGSTPPADVPKLTLLKAKKITIRGRKSLTIRVKGEVALKVTAKASITDAKGRLVKRIRPASASLNVKAFRTKRMRFPLPKMDLARLKEQLHDGRKRYLSLVVTADSATGQAVQKVKIPLSLPSKK